CATWSSTSTRSGSWVSPTFGCYPAPWRSSPPCAAELALHTQVERPRRGGGERQPAAQPDHTGPAGGSPGRRPEGRAERRPGEVGGHVDRREARPGVGRQGVDDVLVADVDPLQA